MLNIKSLFSRLLLVFVLLVSGCSEKEKKVISLEVLKEKGFVIDPKFQPAIEMFEAKAGWNGILNKIKVTIMLFETSKEAENASTAYKEISLGKSKVCNIANMMLTTEAEPCEKIIRIFK